MSNVHPFPTPEHTNMFRQWRAAGYKHLIPVVPPTATLKDPRRQNQAGKMPGVKRGETWSGLKGWLQLEATEAQLDEWSAMGASVGLARREAFLLDIDAYDEEQGDLIQREAERILGLAPCRVGLWPKRALLYRAGGDMSGPPKVVFQSGARTGQIEVPPQAVVHGVHAKTGKPYQWSALKKFENLVVVTPEKLAEFMDHMRALLPEAEIAGATDRRQVDQLALLADEETGALIAEALDAIPNEHDKIGYDEWVKIAACLRGAFQDRPHVGEELFVKFSERSDLAEFTEDPERTYYSLQPPFSIPHSYILEKAKAHGWEGWAKSFLEDLGPEPEKPKEAQRFEFLSFQDIANAPVVPSNKPLIKGLLDQGTMSVLYGDSNVGKTFVGMDIGFHIATGMPYGGMKTTRGLVVYVAAEGGNGAKKRIVALREKYPEQAADADFLLLPSPVNLRQADADLAPLAKSLLGIGRPIALLVIDTLSRALAGGDENSSVDMGALVKNLDWLRIKCAPAHLMVVHHTGKDKAKGARGHSLLRAATDTELEVADGVITATKQRDLDKAWSSAFRLEVRTLGIDEDGDPITSCTVRLEDLEAVRMAPTAGEAVVLEALVALSEISDRADGGVRLADIVSYMVADGGGDKDISSAKIRAFLTRCRNKGLVAFVERGVWRPTGSSVLRNKTQQERNEDIFE